MSSGPATAGRQLPESVPDRVHRSIRGDRSREDALARSVWWGGAAGSGTKIVCDSSAIARVSPSSVLDTTGRAEDPSRPYVRRDPGSGVLCEVSGSHLETLLATGADDCVTPGLPPYVVCELRAYLRSGILAHGLPTPHCPEKELPVVEPGSHAPAVGPCKPVSGPGLRHDPTYDRTRSALPLELDFPGASADTNLD